MVRSPAMGKRRIQSSSTELEDEPVTSPRKSKLQRLAVPSSSSSASSMHGADGEAVDDFDEMAAGEKEEQPAFAADSARSSSGNVSQEGEEDEDEDKYKVWEMFADQYHDIVEQLPLELQRSFQLMLEHDEQMRAHQKALQTATKEYLHLAKSDAYQDAMIKSQLARKMAANLGTTDSIPAQGIASMPDDNVNRGVPMDSNTEVDGSLVDDGGGDAGEQASNSSEEAVRETLIRSTSPTKAHTSSTPAAIGNVKAEDDSTADHMRKLLGDIVTYSRAAIKAGDDKVALAVTAYNWVDRHIHRLDSDLMKHEEALSLGLRPGTQPSTDAREALEHAEENTDTAYLQDPAGLAGGGKGALPYDSRVQHSPARKKGKSKSASLAPSEVPVVIHTSDADGEKYCYCQQASHDIMVGCDNPQCKLQWFHLACLNMAAPPEVEPWYCPECAPLIRQKKAKKKKSSRR